jgi:hypothetical protein
MHHRDAAMRGRNGSLRQQTFDRRRRHADGRCDRRNRVRRIHERVRRRRLPRPLPASAQRTGSRGLPRRLARGPVGAAAFASTAELDIPCPPGRPSGDLPLPDGSGSTNFASDWAYLGDLPSEVWWELAALGLRRWSPTWPAPRPASSQARSRPSAVASRREAARVELRAAGGHPCLTLASSARRPPPTRRRRTSTCTEKLVGERFTSNS